MLIQDSCQPCLQQYYRPHVGNVLPFVYLDNVEVKGSVKIKSFCLNYFI